MTDVPPCQVEPVCEGQLAEAIGFIGGGARRNTDAIARANALIHLASLQGEAGRCVFWARQGKTVLAAAMVVVNPGRAGMLFYSWPTLPGVDSLALKLVIRKLSLHVLQSNLHFVQVLLDSPTTANQDAAILLACGYEFLAELIYMSLNLSAPQAQPITTRQEDDYQWKSMLELSQDELAGVISRTYEHSLDCPGLAGRRQMCDIIASHKSSGIYNPRCWLFPYVGDRPAGCVLISDYPQLDSADVVYLGVVPEFRGHHLARIMLRRAQRLAWQRGMSTMTLAVDSANSYALQAYRAEGFVQTYRRLGYAIMQPL
jgi:ribosomal protein S18 acetylase RimI-like enzyme